ncbi:MAG: hypothetical protein ABIJ21_03185 [Nanoarchaeota archaeon]
MKKIFPLLFVLFLDFVFLAAADEASAYIPNPFLPLIFLFGTLVVTLLLFYDRQFIMMHQEWFRYKKENNPDTVKIDATMELPKETISLKPKINLPVLSKKPKDLSLDMQYQFIDLVRQEIIELRRQGRSDGEIIKQLNSEQWDPQVIYIALSRTKLPEKAQ